MQKNGFKIIELYLVLTFRTLIITTNDYTYITHAGEYKKKKCLFKVHHKKDDPNSVFSLKKKVKKYIYIVNSVKSHIIQLKGWFGS